MAIFAKIAAIIPNIVCMLDAMQSVAATLTVSAKGQMYDPRKSICDMRMYTKNKERFFRKIKKTKDCWFWKGYINEHGYGLVAWGKGLKYVHRVSHEIHKGEIPNGLEIDHLCGITHCVNPDHLEAVTHRENVVRSFTRRKEQNAVR